MPRRKPGTLLALELEILEAAADLQRSGRGSFHGFGLATALRQQAESRALTSHGTLYKALGRLERQGLLSSTWEDAAAVEGRPRRRLYALTTAGALAVQRAAQAAAPSTTVAAEPAPVRRPRVSVSAA